MEPEVVAEQEALGLDFGEFGLPQNPEIENWLVSSEMDEVLGSDQAFAAESVLRMNGLVFDNGQLSFVGKAILIDVMVVRELRRSWWLSRKVSTLFYWL